MLNCYPLGFYHPSTLVKDAERHGVVRCPIDVTRSRLEMHDRDCGSAACGAPGTQYVAGLREEIALRIESERARRPFDSIADLTARVAPNRRELDALAYAGAFAAFGLARRDGAMAGGGGRARSHEPACRREAARRRGSAGRDGADRRNAGGLRRHRTHHRTSSDGVSARRFERARSAQRRRARARQARG